MAFRPPKGVPPPQLDGRRTGRPKRSRSLAGPWRDMRWGYEHREQEPASFPNGTAQLLWTFAREHPYEVESFLRQHGKLGAELHYDDPIDDLLRALGIRR